MSLLSQSQILQIEETDKGLKLSVPNKWDRRNLKSLYPYKPESELWADLFEPYFTNGKYYPINPEYTYVGLTSDPYIISEEIDVDDKGDITPLGALYYCPEYQVISVIEKLIHEGEYTLTRFREGK